MHPHTLLPRNQIIRPAVYQKRRGSVGAAQDLRVGAYGDDLLTGRIREDGDLRGGVLGVWEAGEEEGEGLGAPIHMQDEAPAGVGEGH